MRTVPGTRQRTGSLVIPGTLVPVLVPGTHVVCRPTPTTGGAYQVLYFVCTGSGYVYSPRIIALSRASLSAEIHRHVVS